MCRTCGAASARVNRQRQRILACLPLPIPTIDPSSNSLASKPVSRPAKTPWNGRLQRLVGWQGSRNKRNNRNNHNNRNSRSCKAARLLRSAVVHLLDRNKPLRRARPLVLRQRLGAALLLKHRRRELILLLKAQSISPRPSRSRRTAA